MTQAEVEALIAQVASGDKSITRDGNSLTSHDLSELIDYLKFLQGQEAEATAVANPSFGLRFTKLIPPGAG